MRWSWWRREEQRADHQLLLALLESEKARIAANAQIESGRVELEKRKMELEIEHAEALAKARAEEREYAAKLRQQQREWAANARARKAEKEQAEKARANPPMAQCPVCVDPSNIFLTADQITWHKAGHPAGARNG